MAASVTGVAPLLMGIGPWKAIPKALELAGAPGVKLGGGRADGGLRLGAREVVQTVKQTSIIERLASTGFAALRRRVSSR